MGDMPWGWFEMTECCFGVVGLCGICLGSYGGVDITRIVCAGTSSFLVWIKDLIVCTSTVIGCAVM